MKKTNKKSGKKLLLSKEKVRDLTATNLNEAAGAADCTACTFNTASGSGSVRTSFINSGSFSGSKIG